MADIFRSPFFQPDSASGVPLAGGKLYFYEAGTTTDLTVYQNSSLSTPHAQPVVADASGIFAAIYTNSAIYKVVLKTSADVTVATYDNVNALSATTDTFTVTSADAGAGAGPDIALYRNSASPAASDLIGRVLFQGEDSAGNTETYALIGSTITDPTSTSEDANLRFQTVVAGTLADRVTLDSALKPSTSDGVALGTTTNMWSDLFLASGGVINFNNGAATLTHSSNSILLGSSSGALVGRVASATTTLTNQTLVDWTSLPSTTFRIDLMLAGVSTNGTQVPRVFIGDSGGLETTGYSGTASNLPNAGAIAGLQHGTGAFLAAAAAAATTLNGTITLCLMDSTNNTWSIAGVLGAGNSATTIVVAGTKSLSAVLDRVRLIADGTDQFDAGTVSITYYYI